MPIPNLTGAKPASSILDNLKEATPAKEFISNSLNTALKTSLITAATTNDQQALADVIKTMSPADIAANKDVPLRDFVTNAVSLPNDPAKKQTVQNAIAKLSDKTTVGDLLGLNMPLKDNPLFTHEVAKANLGTLLSTSRALANPQLQDDFITRYTNFKGSMPDFWSQLSQDAQFESVVPELQFTLQLGALSLNNPALVTALRSQYKPASLRDLTKLDTATLAQMITSQNVSVPAGFPGTTPAEKATNYADAIVSLLKGAFPTDYVAHGLATASDAVNKGVATFLTNSQDFDFGSTHIDSYIQKNSVNAFKNVPPPQVETVKSRMKAVQRVFRVNPEYSVIDTMLASGLDSAHKIASIPHSTFIQQYAPKLGGTDQAELVYRSAQHVNGMTSHLYLRIKQAINDSNPRVLG